METHQSTKSWKPRLKTGEERQTDLHWQYVQGNGNWSKARKHTQSIQASQVPCKRAQSWTQCDQVKKWWGAGDVLVVPKAIANCWKEYTEELYYDEVSDQQRSTNVTLEPPPLRSEVAKAMQSVNLKKASGADGVPIELLRYGRSKVIDAMHKICQEVWKTEKWAEDWGTRLSSQYWKRET